MATWLDAPMSVELNWWNLNTSTTDIISTENTFLSLRELNQILKENKMNKGVLNKRTPKTTNKTMPKSPGRPRKPVRVALYEKVVALRLVGADKDKLQELAHDIHVNAGKHEYTAGGKVKKLIDVTPLTKNTVPQKIFDGCAE